MINNFNNQDVEFAPQAAIFGAIATQEKILRVLIPRIALHQRRTIEI